MIEKVVILQQLDAELKYLKLKNKRLLKKID